MKKLMLIFASLLLPAAVLSGQAQALALKVSPAVIRVDAKPGTTVKVDVAVENSTQTPLTASVKVNDFTAPDDNSGDPRLLLDSNNSKYGISSWFSSASSLNIAAGKRVDYSAAFKVPQNASSRTYFGAVRFIDSNNATNASIASLVFINVNAPAAEMQVDNFTYRAPDQTYPNGSFRVMVKNTSEGLFSGDIIGQVKDNEGKEIADFNSELGKSVLPESSRQYTFKLDSALPQQKLHATVTVGGIPNPVTKTIDIDLSPHTTTEPITTKPKSKLPLLAAAAAILGVIILFVALMLRRKSRHASTAGQIMGTSSALPNEPQTPSNSSDQSGSNGPPDQTDQ